MTILEARAKINLFLSVGDVGNGGLHDLTSVMQTVSLSDDLEIVGASRNEVTFSFEGISSAEIGSPDLVARALDAAESLGLGTKRVVVRKRIPIGAGLGGGSADAAAILRYAASEIGTQIHGLADLAFELGSDVPFCLQGGTAFVTERGRSVEALGGIPKMWWVLGISDGSLGTPEVYRRFDERGRGEPSDPGALVEALKRGDLEQVGSSLRNDLEPAAFDLMPALRGKKETMQRSGCLGALISGSGPTVVGLVSSEEDALSVEGSVRGEFDRVEVVHSMEA